MLVIGELARCDQRLHLRDYWLQRLEGLVGAVNFSQHADAIKRVFHVVLQVRDVGVRVHGTSVVWDNVNMLRASSRKSKHRH